MRLSFVAHDCLASVHTAFSLARFLFMNFLLSRNLLLAWCAAVAVSGCVGTGPAAKKPVAVRKAQPAPKPNFWNGDKVAGSPKIVIALKEQRAYFYKGKKLVGETVVSTGRTGFDTPAGKYRVIQKDKDHSSTLYGDFVDEHGTVVKSNVDSTKDRPPEGTSFQGAKMPYFLRFYSGYGLHAGRVPGHRASHGCVRLPAEMAAHFFDNVQTGTQVILKD